MTPEPRICDKPSLEVTATRTAQASPEFDLSYEDRGPIEGLVNVLAIAAVFWLAVGTLVAVLL
jgi:hypothetical protein